MLEEVQANVKVGPGLLCLVQGGAGVGERRGEVSRLDPDDGLGGDLGLGVDNGRDPDPLLVRQADDAPPTRLPSSASTPQLCQPSAPSVPATGNPEGCNRLQPLFAVFSGG